MFAAARFVVVDDNEGHLTAIVKIFQLIGSPCMGIHYVAESPLESRHFRGVRVLFLDLHLVEGLPSTDETRHFAQIASILEDNIAATGGPFVLVVWTRYPNLCRELTAYLDENLDPDKPHARPLSVLCLEKERFINLDTGEIQQHDALREAVESSVSRNAQLAALLSWESDVLAAAGETLASLLDLIPPNLRQTNSYPAALDERLSRLAVASVGKPNVPPDRRAALNSVLQPILGDRIQHQSTGGAMQALWERAITRDQDNLAALEPAEAGRVNRMLHLAIPEAEAIGPTDWGAVVDYPEDWKSDGEMLKRFDSKLKTILGGDFKIERDDRVKCRICLVRIGAVCDYAQHQRGPIPFLLAAEIPIAVERISRTQAAEWKSPILMTNSNDGPFELVANSRYLITLTKSQAESCAVRYRLREQILMQLINHAGQHGTRPGIVKV
jgi:hypothetical protein